MMKEIERKAGVELFDHQVEALDAAVLLEGPQQRVCLYYGTGKGKSLTSLAMLSMWGYEECLVIAPPSTHVAWMEQGQRLGIVVNAVSHAKFRQHEYKVSRKTPVVADEFHLFGGHGGQGWMKLDRLARGLQAPMILASATPNYNDADRVYCIQHILDPVSCRGGFLEFVYNHCTTEQNHFGMMPIVTGFKKFKDAAGYLASQPNVYYLPDDLVYQIEDVPVSWHHAPEFEEYGFDERSGRVVASLMEERHKRIFNGLVNKSGRVYDHIFEQVLEIYDRDRRGTLVYCNHSTVAEALAKNLQEEGITFGMVTGKTSGPAKDDILARFKAGQFQILVGTASLATGTDGLDRVCDTLVILDDTDDDSLRRQLVGRIMPRGDVGDVAAKRVFRLVEQ